MPFSCPASVLKQMDKLRRDLFGMGTNNQSLFVLLTGKVPYQNIRSYLIDSQLGVVFINQGGNNFINNRGEIPVYKQYIPEKKTYTKTHLFLSLHTTQIRVNGVMSHALYLLFCLLIRQCNKASCIVPNIVHSSPNNLRITHYNLEAT